MSLTPLDHTEEKEGSNTSIAAGTSQNLIDIGCISHDSSLYEPDYIWPDGFDTKGNDNDNGDNYIESDLFMKRLVQQFHRDGFIVIQDALSTLFQGTTSDTTSAIDAPNSRDPSITTQELNKAIDELIDGRNESFAQSVKDVVSSSCTPDFTNGDKIPYIQYEAGTVLSSAASTASLLTSGTAPCVRKIMGFVGFHPTIDSVVNHPKLLKIVSRLLLPSNSSKNNNLNSSNDDSEKRGIELFQDMALLKPPNGGREKPWHQDKAYFNIHISEPVVGCWMAIDPATLENGCLRFEMKRRPDNAAKTKIEESGNDPQYPPEMHFMVRDYQICDSTDRRGKVIAIPLQPGGMILFDGMIPHGTPTNNNRMTSSRRRALQFHWTRKNPRRCTTDERYKTFGGIPNGLSC